MKTSIITTLFFALKASLANGFAIYGDCDDFDIHSREDCYAKCGSFQMNWTGNRKGPPDNITECSCTLYASKKDIEKGLPAENQFTCTRTNTPEPKPPVTITEKCDERNIKTFDDCQATCSSLAAPIASSTRINGDSDNIRACFCKWGEESSFTCTRDPPAIPEPRSGRCSDSGIYDQATCNDFCMKYERNVQTISSTNGLLKCRCRSGNGGPINFECRVNQDSYLRSG